MFICEITYWKKIFWALAIIFTPLCLGVIEVQAANTTNCTWIQQITVVSEGGYRYLGGCTEADRKSCEGQCREDTKPKSETTASMHTGYLCCPFIEKPAIPEKTYESLTFTPQVKIPDSAFNQGDIKIGTYNSATKEVTSDLLAKYIKTIYDYGLKIAAILAAIVLMGGGVLWLVSSGEASRVTKARELIVGSVIGLIVLSSSWIILNTINPGLLNLAVLKTSLIRRFDPEPISTEGNQNNSTSCAGCVEIKNIPCKDGNQANSGLVNRLNVAWEKQAGISWRITEAYPPTSNHSSACHNNGMCVDVAIFPAENPPDCVKVTKLIQILESSGLSVLNEYTVCNGKSTQYSTGGHLHVR